MKIYKLSLALILVFFGLTSCHKRLFGIRGKGEIVSETRSISSFDRIELSTNVNVTYVQDSIYSIVVEGQENVLNVLKTTVSGSTLEVDFNRAVYKHKPVTVTVHSPSIYGLMISGSGKISAPSLIKTTSLTLNISGSGAISISNLITESMDATISGSGDISVSTGTASTENITISGSGSVFSVGLLAQKSTVTISGSGDVYVDVLSQLNAKIAGSGNISYKGQPAINTDISGSGDLIHLN